MIGLTAAIERLDARKTAMIQAHGSVQVPDDVGLLLASGLDLDPDELAMISNAIADLTVAVAEKIDIDWREVVAGTWRDGVITMGLLAEMRKESE